MKLPINIIGTKVLRNKAVEIDENYKDLQQFIADMFETMESSNGIGLAAPQVGKSIRLFVVDGTPMAKDEELKDEKLDEFKKAFINPKITKRFGKVIPMEEGCLSVPDIYENVLREESIEIEYFDEKFNQHKEVYHGIKSRIIQHEYDHLEGIIFTDKVAALRRKLLKNKLLAISKGKFPKRYLVKLGK